MLEQRATLRRVAAEQQTSMRRAALQNAQARVDWRSRVHVPVEDDPKKRAQAIRRAAKHITTTARIDTITLGRD